MIEGRTNTQTDRHEFGEENHRNHAKYIVKPSIEEIK